MSGELQDKPNHLLQHSDRRKCSFDTELESTQNQLIDCSSTNLYPHFCNFDTLKSGYFLSGWNSCDNHHDCRIGDADEKHEKKERFSQRNLGSLPFGHESRTKKNEFAFQHHARGDDYMTQYRYNHTVGGTGRSWYDAQIAQTLMNYVRNGQIKFPFISDHDVQLVNSVHQIVEPSLTTGTLNISTNEQPAAQPPRPPSTTNSFLEDNIRLEDNSPSPRPKSAKRISLTPLRKTPEEVSPIVLPKIHIKEYFSMKNQKKHFSKPRTHHNWSCRDPGVVHFVADYRGAYKDNLPYYVADNKVCQKQQISANKNKKYLEKASVKTTVDLMQDLLANRKDLAAQESIQSLVKFFTSDQSIESDDLLNSLDNFDTWIENESLTSGSQGATFGSQEAYNNQELMINGMSSVGEKTRTQARAYKDSFSDGHFDIKIPVRCTLPLSKDTVLFGAPYRKHEEHHTSVD